MNTAKSLSLLTAISILHVALLAMPATAQRRVCVETDQGRRVCGRLVEDYGDNYNDYNYGSNSRCGVSGFDENFYLEAYPDVEAAVRQRRFRSGCDHYQKNGRFEGRFPRFNEASYLANNPDVAQAVRERRFRSGYAHWREYGRYERRKL
ncbi:MAG: hypothetical protein NW224_20660 [Leptolyngbyaceae cyanobacterium bins.302]|nr:hypothetical protein [Leptolyngbyaceae cyanobacterium bins.302]